MKKSKPNKNSKTSPKSKPSATSERIVESTPPPATGPASYPALKNDQNGRIFYTLTVPIEDLFPWCYVARREDNRQSGFQRHLDEKRAQEIAEYLDAGKSIAQNITLSAQPEASLAYDRSNKSIRFQRDPKSFMILDGQHRTYGYHLAKTKLRVPVAIYTGLTLAEEVELFDDINTKQKGVPNSLLLDIRAMAGRETEHQAVLHALFDGLCFDHKSVAREMFAPCSSERGMISRVTFNRAAGPALRGSVFVELEPEHRVGVFQHYLGAIYQELADKTVMARPAFFEAAMAMMDEVLRASLAEKQSLKMEDICEIVRPIAALDYSSAAFGGARPTKAAVTAAMQAVLRKPVVIAKEAI